MSVIYPFIISLHDMTRKRRSRWWWHQENELKKVIVIIRKVLIMMQVYVVYLSLSLYRIDRYTCIDWMMTRKWSLHKYPFIFSVWLHSFSQSVNFLWCLCSLFKLRWCQCHLVMSDVVMLSRCTGVVIIVSHKSVQSSV